MLDLLKKVWHYFWNIIIKRKVLSRREQKKMGKYGAHTCILNPYLAIDPYQHIFIDDNTTINKLARLQCFADAVREHGEIHIGKSCYIGFRFTVLAGPASKIVLGNQVLVASDVIITSENHGMDPESNIPYMDQPLVSADVTIGNGCWIGEKVCIMPGVSIGEKAIIGAGSIVTHDIPAYTIAVGSPAKPIKKYNFDEHRWDKIEVIDA